MTRVAIDAMARDVALACRMLAHRGLAQDVLGHVSARVDGNHLLVRCRGPHERGLRFTMPADIGLVGLDGSSELGSHAVPNELPIHTAILRRRSEVGAVVHVHAWSTVVLALARLPLLPLVGAFDIPVALLAARGIPTYGRAVLIHTDALGDELADAMGSADACLLRGHGLVTTGASVAEAVVRAVAVERLARLTLDVVAAGASPQPIADRDLAELPDLGAQLNVDALWRHYVAALDADGHGLAAVGVKP